MSHSSSASPPPSPSPAIRLELGCGMRPTPGYIHHDRVRHSPHVDLAWDLRRRPWVFYVDAVGVLRSGDPGIDPADPYARTGPTPDKIAGILDEILALDVFEHVSVHIPDWLDECWRLLRPGGLLDFRVPAWDHALSYRDPTHLRVFHPQTMEYWDPRTELHRDFGSIYFAESGRWWHQEECFREHDDLRFRLRKPAD